MRFIVALLVFGVIVLFHEFGHFTLARKNGIVVEEFAIGMGPKLFGIRRGQTQYTIRLLPIGGACMMRGEDSAGDGSEGCFGSKSVWARMAVVFAGPFFNFIMAFGCALAIIASSGYISGEIMQVQEGSPAQEAGLQAGDVITKVDHTKVKTFEDFRLHIALNEGKPCTITYVRGGRTEQTLVSPRKEEDGVYRIGIVGGVRVRPGPLGLVAAGFHEVGSNISLVIKSLEMLIAGKVSSQEISGPVGMFSAIGQSYQEAAQYGEAAVILTLLDLILLLSANLGVMNLLPLPALDGGRLVFLIVEAVRGKPVPPEKEGMVHFVGFVLLMILMVFVMFNDISRILGR